MNPLYERMTRFLHSLGDESGTPVAEVSSRNLPLFVSAPYDFCRTSIWGHDCLVLTAKNQIIPAPEQIIAQKKLLDKLIPGDTVFVFPSGTKEFCSHLIKAQIPFIIPDRQIYLPGKLVSLQQDKFSARKDEPRQFFSPWAQVILLFHLLNHEHGSELAFQFIQTALKVNKVYISRSAKELEQAGIAEISAVGRNKYLVFLYDRRTLWEKMQDKLTSPVLKRIRLVSPPEKAIRAGISALSDYSLLNDDPDPVFAVYGRKFGVDPEELREFSGPYLELWKYDPLLLSGKEKSVDKLSLYLSLRDHSDPRVSGELQKMMEAFIW